MKASELFQIYRKTPDFDQSNYPLFERIPAVPGTSNNRGLTVLLRTSCSMAVTSIRLALPSVLKRPNKKICVVHDQVTP